MYSTLDSLCREKKKGNVKNPQLVVNANVAVISLLPGLLTPTTPFSLE